MMVKIIAEIAQTHDGSLGVLHSLIDALAPTGVDIIKFQTHIADAESSLHEPFRINFSYEDKTRYDYWKRMEFSDEQWVGIKEHCDKLGVEFVSSPFSNQAVNLLERLNVNRYKIGSGEVTNKLLLEKIALTGKQVILSSGMSSFNELDQAVALLKDRDIALAVLQCTTSYPTDPSQIGLNILEELRNRYQVPVGLSDHSGTIYPGLAAVALGAEYLEFHVTFDKRMFGPDASASLDLTQTRQLVEGVRYLEKCLDNPIEKDHLEPYIGMKKIFEKSLAVNKDLPKGHILEFDDLESKKPADLGISAGDYKNVIGRCLTRDLTKYSFITHNDIE